MVKYVYRSINTKNTNLHTKYIGKGVSNYVLECLSCPERLTATLSISFDSVFNNYLPNELIPLTFACCLWLY